MRRLTDEQQAAVDRRDGDLLLSANAGSGKTTVLAERFARSVVDDGLRPDQLLAITFTEKAAGELRHRVRTRLTELGRRDAAAEMDSAWVSTIHGFCARVLRTHAVLAGLDPRFSVLDDSAGRTVRGAAWDAALAAFLADPGGAERLDLVASCTPDGLCETVMQVHDELRSRGLPAELPPAQARESIDDALAAVAAAFAVLRAELATVSRDHDAIDAVRELVAEPVTPALAGRVLKTRNLTELTTPAARRAAAALDALTAAALDAQALGDWALLAELVADYAARYAGAKRDRGALDFSDLELGLRDLLTEHPALRAAYAERFARIMVDEFQDTNPLQVQIVALLDAGNVFAVGDELQSIYGFRHADVSVFRARRAEASGHGQALTLATNWRSHPELLSTLNALFSQAHEHWVPLNAGRADPPDGAPPRTELLVVDRAAHPSTGDARAAEADAVAARVAELVEQGTAPGDVALLLRAASDMALYEAALQRAGLPTLASGGRGFWGRQQVQDLTAYLALLANPRDGLALMSALASPLCGATSDELARLAQDAREAGVTPWDAARSRFAEFTARIEAERLLAPRLSLDTLIARAVEAGGYDLHVLPLPGGRRRLANVTKLQRLAAAFEAERGRDLRGFIDFARAELEADAREPDAPIDPGDSTAVQLMSIHAAKGLEFAVVVVADLGRQRSAQTPRVLIDGDRTGLRVVRAGEESQPALDFAELRAELAAREIAEERRIVHVAVTRAKERLILATTAKLDGWPSASTTAPPIAYVGALIDPDLPAKLAAGGGEVVYDEPRPGGHLRLTARLATAPPPPSGAKRSPSEPFASVAQSEIPAQTRVPVASDVPESISYSQLAAHERCGYRFYLERVLRLPVNRDDGPVVVGGEVVAGLDPRVRGSILHDVLEAADLAAAAVPGDEQLDGLAAAQDAELTPDDRDDLRNLVQRFLDSPLRARLAQAADLRREDSFTFALGATLVNGKVDVRAREPDGTMLVVDYKTDRLRDGEDPESLVGAGYTAQRLIYALAELRAGAPRVEVCHLFLDRPDQPAVARFEAAERDALDRQLQARARGLLSGDFPVAMDPHAQLCRGCPGRGTLCVWPRELTEQISV